MTPVILPRRHPYLHGNGVTATVPHNILATKIQAHAPPTITAQRRTDQGMATTRHTSGSRGQKINAQYVSTLQGNCSHRIRRRTTTNVIRALPLKAIKGETCATSKGDQVTTARVCLNRNHTSRTTTHKRPGICSLSKACNPYYEHPGARQHEPQRNPLDVRPFMPEPVYILVFTLHTIEA
jgi:hypothetical protein